MLTRINLNRTLPLWRVAAGLVLAVTLIGCASTATETKPHRTGPVPQDPDSFQLTEAVKIPADVRADYDNALRLLTTQQVDQGIALLLNVTHKAPTVAAPYVDLGIAYGKSGDLDKAVSNLKHAVELNPRQVVAYNELGIVYRRKGEFAAARDSYEHALSVFPRFRYARLNLALLCDLYLGDLSCARDNYLAYQQLVPDDKQVAKWIADLDARAKP